MAECKTHPGTERVPMTRGGLQYIACPKCVEEKKNAKESGAQKDDKKGGKPRSGKPAGSGDKPGTPGTPGTPKDDKPDTGSVRKDGTGGGVGGRIKSALESLF